MARSALHDFWQNNAECGFTGCPSGQVRTCGNVCVTPVATGDPCDPNDCESDSVCEEGSCVVTGLFTAECMALPDGYTLLSECSQNPNACPHDTFCMDTKACLDIDDWGHRCSVGVPHGYHCDSNWDDPECAPCMPGTLCVGAAGNKRCRMECGDSGDCPCGDSGAVNGCNQNDGLCYRCRATGYTCNENTLCCDAGTICGPLSGVCCPQIGSTCTGDGDCCDEHVCRSNGTCNVCVPELQACTGSADCCSKLCVNGYCREDCTLEAGKPCPVPNKQGECKKGVVTCIKSPFQKSPVAGVRIRALGRRSSRSPRTAGTPPRSGPWPRARLLSPARSDL